MPCWSNRVEVTCKVFKTKLGKGGRIVIPAEYWRELGADPGDETIMHLDEEGLRLHTPAQVVARAQSLVQRYVSGERSHRIWVPYVQAEIVNGKRRITPSTALRLAKAFGTGPEFWLNGQLASDLYRTINDEKEIGELEQIEPFPR